ncbi:hypothetical protein K7432_004350 [Basidiobolus ranarum]|uniref:F-box domain-containing protein n=1 Tax=Basidiobolus ranarum TaxID=34480 RepID=A0ABR2W5Q9_9FUNG
MTFESDTLLDSDELSEFRKQWKDEVEAGKRMQVAPSLPKDSASKSKEVQNKAELEVDLEISAEKEMGIGASQSQALQTKPLDCLEYYIRAVSYEKQGNLNAALLNYRLAFKLNPYADDLYKQYCQEQNSMEVQKSKSDNKEEFQFERHIQIGEDYEAIHAEHPDAKEFEDPLKDLLQDMKQMNLSYSPLDPDKAVHIAILPDELVLFLFKNLLLQDIQSIGRLGRSCKKFLMLTRDSAIWKFGCQVFFKDPLDKEMYMLKRYHQSWRQMYIDRPRLRLDGVYISTCYYLRQGSAENVWSQPVHMITYYRYLRFYNDGTCIKLLSSDEPSRVVKHFRTGFKAKGFMTGTYKCSEDHVTIEVKDSHRITNTFFLSLTLKSTTRGKQNKLSWIEYCSEDSARNHEITQYSLQHYRSFFFSRVRSYKAVKNISVY